MSTRKILILGAGYTGKELAHQARQSGYDVVGTSRDPATRAFLERLGAQAVDWSVDDDCQAWATHLGPSTTVVYSIPTLFRRYDASNDGLARHIIPVDHVLGQCRRRGIERFIYLSSSSVYGDHGGEWIDESTPCHPSSPYGRMRHDIERHLLQRDMAFPIHIARLVGIYGPGRTLVEYIKSGRYRLVDGGKKITNRIHVHDIARALLAIIEKARDEHQIFNLTDGHPQAVRDLVEYVCDHTGLTKPPVETLEEYAARKNDPNAVARWKKQVRVRNDRLRRELDFELIYPDVFAGYKAILEASSGPRPTEIKNPSNSAPGHG